MRTFSKKKLVVTAVAATVLVGTGTAAFAYWTSQGTGRGTATTAAEATTLKVDQIGTPKDMYPGDAEQKLIVKVTNPGPNKVEIAGVSVVPTVTLAEGMKDKCDPSDYQVNGKQLPAEGTVTLNWKAVELAAGADQDSTNTVQFFDKAEANQDGCKGATLVLSYTAR
jgi:archaellin